MAITLIKIWIYKITGNKVHIFWLNVSILHHLEMIKVYSKYFIIHGHWRIQWLDLLHIELLQFEICGQNYLYFQNLKWQCPPLNIPYSRRIWLLRLFLLLKLFISKPKDRILKINSLLGRLILYDTIIYRFITNASIYATSINTLLSI